ncbi:MAG: hypothetical protein ABI778_04435 [Ignavibacteriota bacterium]
MNEVRQINILLSSPGDLAVDRAFINSYVDTVINRVLEGFVPIQFKVRLWEMDAVSGTANEAQEVIDSSIPPYDVYLGLLWKRIGTPTMGSISGTVHEYEDAKKRFESMESKRLMFFLREDNQNIGEIDARKLVEMQDFKMRIHEEGTLTYSYYDQNTLKDLVLMQLSGLARILTETTHSSTIETNTELQTRKFIEQIQLGDLEFLLVQDSVVELAACIDTASKKMRVSTSKLLAVAKYRPEIKKKKVKEITQEIIGTFDQRSLGIFKHSPKMTEHFSRAVENYSRALSVPHVPQEILNILRKNITHLEVLQQNLDVSIELYTGLAEKKLNYDDASLIQSEKVSSIAITSLVSAFQSVRSLTTVLSELLISRLV